MDTVKKNNFILSVLFDESINKTFNHYFYVFICVVRPYSGWNKTGYIFSDYITDYLRCLANARLVSCSFSWCLRLLCPAGVLLIPALFRLGVSF